MQGELAMVRLRKSDLCAGMGRNDEYYCDVLSSGVNLFLVNGSSLYSIHWSFIVQDLLAASWQLFGLYQVTYIFTIPDLHYTQAHIVANTKCLQSM